MDAHKLTVARDAALACLDFLETVRPLSDEVIAGLEQALRGEPVGMEWGEIDGDIESLISDYDAMLGNWDEDVTVEVIDAILMTTPADWGPFRVWRRSVNHPHADAQTAHEAARALIELERCMLGMLVSKTTYDDPLRANIRFDLKRFLSRFMERDGKRFWSVNVKGFFEKLRRSVRKEWALAVNKTATPTTDSDGPCGIHQWRHDGTVTAATMQPAAWRMCNALWESPETTASFDDLKEPVYNDREHIADAAAFGALRKAANRFLVDAQIPLNVSLKKTLVKIGPAK